MKLASAITQHPNPIQATGEIVGRINEYITGSPTIILNFITPDYNEEISKINETLNDIVRPFSSITCISEGIVGITQEIENGPGISSLAIDSDDAMMIDLSYFSKLNLQREVDLEEWNSYATTWNDAIGDQPGFMLLIANPFRFDISSYMIWHEVNLPQVPIVGSLMYGNGPEDQRLFTGRDMKLCTAVAILFSRKANITPIYSYSFSPVGEPFTVTEVDSTEIITLGNKTPLDYLIRLATTKFSKNQIRLVNSGMLKLGKVINDSKLNYHSDDFLPMDIIGVKQDIGSLIVESTVEVGSTVQFLLDDPQSATNDLATVLGSRHARGALLFPNITRGNSFFGRPHQDARTVAATISPDSVCGHFSKLPFCFSDGIIQQSKNAISAAIFNP